MPKRRTTERKSKKAVPELELTPEENRFVEEWTLSCNSTTSYQRAYPGTPYDSARTLGSRMYAKVNIKAEIARRQKEISKRLNIKTERVIREVALLAFSDIENVVDLSDRTNPQLRDRNDIPPECRRSIQEISKTQHGVKIKLADKAAALDKLMRHLGLYNDLPPLEVLLASLPPDIAATVRTGIAETLHKGRAKNPDESGKPTDGPTGTVPG